MNLHRPTQVSAFLHAFLLELDLPQLVLSLVLSAVSCLPLLVESLACSVQKLVWMKRLTQDETNHLCFLCEKLGLTINVTPDHVLRDHVVLLDLVDRLALPEFFHLVKKPLLLSTPVVLVKNLLPTLLVLNVSLSPSSQS